jgi:hypothetical protein
LLLAGFDSGYDITPKEYYIGDLKQDAYETITLGISLTDVSVGKHNLGIELAYKDPYNQEFVESKSIDFTVLPSIPFTLTTTQIVLIIAAIALILWKGKSLLHWVRGLLKRK